MWAQALQEVLPLPLCCPGGSWDLWRSRKWEIRVSPKYIWRIVLNPKNPMKRNGFLSLFLTPSFVFSSNSLYCLKHCEPSKFASILSPLVFFSLISIISFSMCKISCPMLSFFSWPENGDSANELQKPRPAKTPSKAGPSKVWLLGFVLN